MFKVFQWDSGREWKAPERKVRMKVGPAFQRLVPGGITADPTRPGRRAARTEDGDAETFRSVGSVGCSEGSGGQLRGSLHTASMGPVRRG